MYSEYCCNSWAQWGKAQRMADVVAFQAMVQSPWDWMHLDGLPLPTERSKSPMEVVILSSARVEKSPEKMTSRLTAVPERMCVHSGFGKGGSDPADCYGYIDFSLHFPLSPFLLSFYHLLIS